MKDYITVQEAVIITDLAPSTITRAAASGILKGFKNGKKWSLDSKSVLNLTKKPKLKLRDGRKPNKPREDSSIDVDLAEQLTIFDVNPLPKHAKRQDSREWEDAPRFSYNDLLTQYQRGIEEGYRRAKEGQYEAN